MKLVYGSLSCFSSFVHETKLVSVVGEFLWSGERPVDDDVQCFPGGPPGVLFRVRGHRNNACNLYRFG